MIQSWPKEWLMAWSLLWKGVWKSPKSLYSRHSNWYGNRYQRWALIYPAVPNPVLTNGKKGTQRYNSYFPFYLQSPPAYIELRCSEAVCKIYEWILPGQSKAGQASTIWQHSRCRRTDQHATRTDMHNPHLCVGWVGYTTLSLGLRRSTSLQMNDRYASDLDLPDEVIGHPVIEELRVIITDIVWMYESLYFQCPSLF